MIDFATALKHARERSGKTATAVAQEAGISPQFLGDLERGQRNPLAPTARRLALTVGADPDHFALLSGWKRVPTDWQGQIRRLEEALGFAASVIKSGESWTATCEDVIGGALRHEK